LTIENIFPEHVIIDSSDDNDCENNSAGYESDTTIIYDQDHLSDYRDNTSANNLGRITMDPSSSLPKPSDNPLFSPDTDMDWNIPDNNTRTYPDLSTMHSSF
jgi:hypothetical protein